MQHIIILYVIKVIDRILRGLNHLLNFCVLIIAGGCISKCAYYTAYREIWRTHITLSFCIVGGCFLLSIIESILVSNTDAEDLVIFFEKEKVEKWQKKLKFESEILWWLFIITIVVGKSMVGMYVQSFTGDPWWAGLYQMSFAIMTVFELSKGFRNGFVYEKLMKTLT